MRLKQTFVFTFLGIVLSTPTLLSTQTPPQQEIQQKLTSLFGPNVFVFSSSTPAAQLQERINKVYALQEHAEFGSSRYAFLFLPGDYHVNIPVGFYTEVAGLGASPDAVHVTGNMHADASLPRNNATCTFWRAAEGLTVTPSTGTLQWATSQAISFRRMHVLGNMVLHQNHGWASGGWISDSVIDGNVDSGSQQQWISRNAEWKSWTGSNWNMVFVGVKNPPSGNWPDPAYTRIDRTPISREKPFLFVDAHNNLNVLVRHFNTTLSESAGTTAPPPAEPFHSRTSMSLTPLTPQPLSTPHSPPAKTSFSHPASTTSPNPSGSLTQTPSSSALVTPRCFPPTAPLQ